MKNLLIYISPIHLFDKESEVLIKVQIDNSLELGWKIEDIVLVTNFPYEYMGIKAMVVSDEAYCSAWKLSTKTSCINYLFEHNLIGDYIYWSHDLDAYQLEIITEEELELDKEVGFCDYGRNEHWQMGSFFFKNTAGSIFKDILLLVKEDRKDGKEQNDENSLVILTNKNYNNINDRIKRMNGTYDFGMRRVELCYEKANKPLKVLHFHPWLESMNTLKIAMYGKNRIRKPLMNKRLIKLFQKYGIK